MPSGFDYIILIGPLRQAFKAIQKRPRDNGRIIAALQSLASSAEMADLISEDDAEDVNDILMELRGILDRRASRPKPAPTPEPEPEPPVVPQPTPPTAPTSAVPLHKIQTGPVPDSAALKARGNTSGQAVYQSTSSANRWAVTEGQTTQPRIPGTDWQLVLVIS